MVRVPTTVAVCPIVSWVLTPRMGPCASSAKCVKVWGTQAARGPTLGGRAWVGQDLSRGLLAQGRGKCVPVAVPRPAEASPRSRPLGMDSVGGLRLGALAPALLSQEGASCTAPGPPSGAACGLGGGAGGRRSRPGSHGRSVRSPGVANSGCGQLCSGAEAVISGPENSCLERARRPASWRLPSSPGAPPGPVPPAHAFPFQGPGGPTWAGVWLGRRPHLTRPGPPAFHSRVKASLRRWRRPQSCPERLLAPSRNRARAVTWRTVGRMGNSGERQGWGLAPLSVGNIPGASGASGPSRHLHTPPPSGWRSLREAR